MLTERMEHRVTMQGAGCSRWVNGWLGRLGRVRLEETAPNRQGSIRTRTQSSCWFLLQCIDRQALKKSKRSFNRHADIGGGGGGLAEQ